MSFGSSYHVFLLSLALILRLLCFAWESQQDVTESLTMPSDYTFAGGSGPQIWQINELPHILMPFENTVRYQIDDDEGTTAEWDALAPGRGQIYLGDNSQPFSISMFHQLRCLDVLRSELVLVIRPNSTLSSNPALGRHCLNYMRQMILCRSDLNLETVTAVDGAVEVLPDVYQCRDWKVVYDEVQRNQDNHRLTT